MKLRSILETDSRAKEPFLTTPSHVPMDQRFFVDRGFELGVLDDLRLGTPAHINDYTYENQNRIYNLADRDMVEIDELGNIKITEIGNQFAQEWQKHRNSVITQTSIDPGGWNPVSGATWGGFR